MEGDTSQDMRYAPPQAHVEDVAAPEAGLVLAGRGERLRAALVDGVIAMVFWLAAGRLLAFSPWAAGESWPALAVNVLIGYVLFAAIHGHSLATRGQTLGKRVVGIRIARPDGSAASLGRLLGVRYGLGYLAGMLPIAGQAFAMVDVLLIFRESRRCLHDNIADTIVVKA